MRSSVDAVLREARRASGLTQRELARRSGTSSATLSLYERGLKEPRLSTLERLLAATAHRLELRAVPAPGRGVRLEERSIAVHRAVIDRLREDPVSVLAKARRNLATMRAANRDGSADRWLDAWERLLDGPLDTLSSRAVANDPTAAELRQNTPFAGVLSPQERWAVYRRFAA